MNLLDYKTDLMYQMIQDNADVTIGEFWKELYDEEWCPAVKVVVSNRRFSRAKKEPMKDPAPFKRVPAIYDNRGHSKIIEEYQ